MKCAKNNLKYNFSDLINKSYLNKSLSAKFEMINKLPSVKILHLMFFKFVNATWLHKNPI